MGCPCKEGRYGAFALVVSLYWAMQCGGIAATLHLALAGYAVGVWWAIWTGLGVAMLAQGIREARSHDDAVNGGSVLVSVGLIGLALYAVANHWFFPGNDFVGNEWMVHASRVFWFGLLGSEAFNLWLNFRGRRRAAPPTPEPVEQPRRFGLRRRRRVEVVEEIEGRGIDAADLARLVAAHLGANAAAAPPHISRIAGPNGQLPQIVYVPDENGQLIPVALPSPERVRR